MENTNKTYHTLIAKRILIAEVISFAIGVVVMVSESVAGITYFGFWFILTAFINAITIILLLMRRPENYLKFSVNLFIVPIACAWILYVVVRRIIN